MRQNSVVWLNDSEALSLSRVARFLKPLVDKTGSKAPVSSLRVSCVSGLTLTQGQDCDGLERSPVRVNYLSGVTLRANRSRDNKTFSDALAVDLSTR